ncbi:response regulator [Microlunatus sp. GCM10028923]|uniref:response regulator n=1 Tax=Microlunatus sp. GCM10028923 TaxID=3273400 RepID=UPI0036178FD3
MRVLVADDHALVRQGIRGMLAAVDDIEIVAEAASGDEAVTLAHRLAPDVILMDLRMPGGDGVSAIRRLDGHRVIVLTTYSDDADIRPAIEAGAVGYLLKDVSINELTAAIRAVAAGRQAWSPEVTARLTRRAEPPALSDREREVLGLVGEGLTNAEIGARLFIGEATVKTYLVRIFGKLGVADRTAAVVAALSRGLLP